MAILTAAAALLTASPARADIYFDFRLGSVQPASVTYVNTKSATVAPGTPAGTTVNLEIYAVITNTATPASAKKLSGTYLSEFSTMVPGNELKIRGDLAGDPFGTPALNTGTTTPPYVAVPYRGATANIGWQSEIIADGDLGIGTLISSGAFQNHNMFFRPDGGTTFAWAPEGTDVSANWGAGGAEFLLGTAAFTINSTVVDGAQAQLQLAPRVKDTNPKTVHQWWENGSTLIRAMGDDSRVRVGTPVLLTTIPEPSTFVLLVGGMLGLIVLPRWRKSKR